MNDRQAVRTDTMNPAEKPFEIHDLSTWGVLADLTLLLETDSTDPSALALGQDAATVHALTTRLRIYGDFQSQSDLTMEIEEALAMHRLLYTWQAFLATGTPVSNTPGLISLLSELGNITPDSIKLCYERATYWLTVMGLIEPETGIRA